MKKNEHLLTVNHHDGVKVETFVARIDKSKVRLKYLKADKKTLSVEYSPYFVRNTSGQREKPLLCSLTEQEANHYCYRLPEEPLDDDDDDDGEDSTREKSKESINITKLILFKPTAMAASLTPRSKKPNVIQTTPIAMLNSCKNYPPVSTRAVLNKYAHLFGLKSIK